MKALRNILSLNEDRKESTKIVTAFLNKKSAKGARTHSDGSGMYLHGNKIAWHGDNGEVHATLAGWNTPTTRERLNTLCNHMGCTKKFSMKKGVGHYGPNPIDSRDVVKLNEDVDQLDELSRATLGSYIKSAHRDKSSLAFMTPDKRTKLAYRNRKIGLDRATDKLVKEDQLDELSRATLGSYIKKAHRDKIFLAFVPPNKRTKLAYKNRTTGLDRATDKLVKEDAEALDEKRGIAGLIQRWKQRGVDKKPGLKFGNALRKVSDGSRLTVNSAKKKAKVLGTSAADPRLADNKPNFKLKSVKTQSQAPLGKTARPGKFLKTLPPSAKKPKPFASKPLKPLVVKPIKAPKLTKPKVKSLIANAKATTARTMKPKMPKVNNA